MNTSSDDQQSIEHCSEPEKTVNCDNKFTFSKVPSLEDIRRIQSEFSSERNWNQYHSPRNLLLAMVGEVGELAELFQWKGDAGGDDATKWSSEERTKLEHELSDVFIYLIRIADICKVDLPVAALNKIKLNSLKYPVNKSYGSAKKYTDLG